METQAIRHGVDTRRAATEPQQFPPLESVTRPTVPTEQAGYYLDRRPQTMRIWAMRQTGPLQAIRVHGRLAWPVADIRKLLALLLDEKSDKDKDREEFERLQEWKKNIRN